MGESQSAGRLKSKDTVGRKEIAKALKMKEDAMSKKGLGYVAANGSNIENYGEKSIAGHTESGDGMIMKTQRADVKKVLGSVNKLPVRATRKRPGCSTRKARA